MPWRPPAVCRTWEWRGEGRREKKEGEEGSKRWREERRRRM